MRREPRPLKEERKCFGVAEPEKRGKVGRGAAREGRPGRRRAGIAECRGAPCRHKAAAIFAGGGGPGRGSESGDGRVGGGRTASATR